MGGGKGKAPPAPDYAAISAANKEAAEVAAAVQREQLAWAKEQYAQDKAANKEISDVFIDQMNLQKTVSEEERARYKAIYQPLEDKLAKEAAEYDTPERRAAEAARQVASVDQQFEAARNAAEAQATSYGIDPGQMRMGALDLGSRIQEATAKAAGAAAGRQQVEQTGRALQSQAIDVGRGLPGQYSQASALTGQMGQNAANTNLATTASGAQTMGTGLQWAGVQNQALGNWGQYASNIYGSQLQYKAATAGNSPWKAIGSLAGTALGGWASGGFKAEGGAIPDGASPSGGGIPDDVPTMTTPGEYVLPNWLVEKTGGIKAWDTFVRSHGGDPEVVSPGGGANIGGFVEGFGEGVTAGMKTPKWGNFKWPWEKDSTDATKQTPTEGGTGTSTPAPAGDRTSKFGDETPPPQPAPTASGGAGAGTQPTQSQPPAQPSQWDQPIINAAKAAGIDPALFRSVINIESAFNPKAVSPAGAIGLAQLMPGTARGLGVDPNDPIQNLKGGATFLKQMIDRYGDTQTALMAYNWGPGNVDRWIAGGRDPNRIPRETRAHFSKIMGGVQRQHGGAIPDRIVPIARADGGTIPYPGGAGSFDPEDPMVAGGRMRMRAREDWAATPMSENLVDARDPRVKQWHELPYRLHDQQVDERFQYARRVADFLQNDVGWMEGRPYIKLPDGTTRAPTTEEHLMIADLGQLPDMAMDWMHSQQDRRLMHGGGIPLRRQEGGGIPEPGKGYTVPFDVAHRMGTDKLDKMVEKSRNPQATSRGKGGGGSKRQQQQQPPADPVMMRGLMDMMIPPRGGTLPAAFPQG